MISNRMELERIKHEAAKIVFSGTRYDWTDMMDNTADLDRELSRCRTSSEAKLKYIHYFIDMLESMEEDDNA